MTKSIITVSREFGSGGRTIAHKVAERLGVPYYDKELIKAVAEKTGFDPKFIEERGEYAPGRTIFSMLPVFDGTQGALSAADFLWAMQRQVILDLADKGPCVILGRCADYILKDRSDVLAPEHRARAFNDFGVFRPVLLHGGRIVGQWGRKGTQVGVEPFAGEKRPSARLLRSAEGRWKLFREGQAFS